MLVGRDAELAEIAARLRTSRLITIVGPGGVGKTALSRAAATRAGADFSMGVREVDLTRVDQPAAVAGAVAAQVGFDSFDALLSSPSDRPALLLVDNCEHLLDAVAQALVMLLGACQQATVIATSRSPLELPGESIVALAPLPLPARGADPVGNPAVELFLQRARDAGATIAGADIEQVAELCRHLDGLPLAIEIAAARARTMNVAEITARMTATIDVLSRPRFRGDPRHRSITDTVRWSVDLLAPSQAQLLERLAVFAGPFTAENGRVLAGNDGPHFATDLDELINASLVTVETSAPVTRFRLLDTVRRFGLDQLHAKGELIAVYDTYVDHVLASVRQTLTGAGESWRPTLVHDLVAGFDDIAEAITHAVTHDETPRRAYILCGILWAIVHQYRAGDIVELGRSVMTRWPDDESPLAAQAIASLATAEYVTGHPDRAVSLAEGALARRPEPGPALIVLHRVLGQSTRALGDLERSEATFRAGAAIGHGVGLTAMALELDTAAALVGADRGDLERAMADIEEVVRRA
jgi:non-specific serine/threonine protein kinase